MIRVAFLSFRLDDASITALEFLPEKLETSRIKRSILCLFIASVDQWNLRLENMLKYLKDWIRHNLNEGLMQSVYYSSEKQTDESNRCDTRYWMHLWSRRGIMLCDLTHKKTLWSILSSCDVFRSDFRLGHGGGGRRALAVPRCFAGFAVHLLGWVAHPPNKIYNSWMYIALRLPRLTARLSRCFLTSITTI